MKTPELPGHLAAVRDAVLEGLPDEPLLSHASLGRIRGELKRRMQPHATGLGEGVEIHVHRHVLPAALVCPASATEDEFEWMAPLAARSLGLPAVASMYRGPDVDVGGAVDASIAEALEEQKSIGVWLAELDGTERAVTAAAASTWAARAWVAVPWAAFANVRFGLDSVWQRPLGFGSAIVLRGRPDASVLVRRRKATERVLLDLGRFDPVVARLDALTVALKVGRAPLRVVTVHPASGAVDAIDVDVAVLDQAVDDIEAAVGALAPAARGEAGAEVPGRQCWSCDRADECATGAAWRASQPRRIAGIPVAAVPVTVGG